MRSKISNAPTLSSPQLTSETGLSRELNYIPFCYEYTPPLMYDRSWFRQQHEDEMRDWADSLEVVDIQKIIRNLIDSLINRAETGKAATASIGLVLIADPALQALQYLARTQENLAAENLTSVLKRAVDRLNHNDEANTKVMKSVAPAQIFWPVNYSPNTFLNTNQDELQERLNIGDDYFFEIKSNKRNKGKGQRKSFDFHSPTNQMALRIIETISANRYPRTIEFNSNVIPEWVRKCKTLPLFSKQSVEKWAEVGWEAICDAYNGKPEMHPELRKIGSHRATDIIKPSTRESVIRSEIRAEIKPALKKLARNN